MKFDAAQWAGIARKARMKYAALTAKHHDGFSMFDSKPTSNDIVDATPFKRDVTGELAAAFRVEGPALRLLLFGRPRLKAPARPGQQLQAGEHMGFPDKTSLGDRAIESPMEH